MVERLVTHLHPVDPPVPDYDQQTSAPASGA